MLLSFRCSITPTSMPANLYWSDVNLTVSFPTPFESVGAEAIAAAVESVGDLSAVLLQAASRIADARQTSLRAERFTF